MSEITNDIEVQINLKDHIKFKDYVMDVLRRCFPKTIELETFNEVVTGPKIYHMNTGDKLEEKKLTKEKSNKRKTAKLKKKMKKPLKKNRKDML